MGIPNRDKQYFGPAESREERNLKEFRLQPELGDHEVEDPGGGKGGHLLGLGGH